MSEFSKNYHLTAIIIEVKAIKSFVHDYDFADYANDLKTQYAMERALLNISEAVRNFEKNGQRVNPDFTLASISSKIEWAKIKGIGNIMRHDYENVTSSRVWNVITDHLNPLQKACEEALEK